MFLKKAIRLLNDWHQHAYDSYDQHFWGSLKLDGTPVEGPRVTGGYKQYEPRGHMDLWNPYALGYEHPLEAARSYTRAAHISEDPELLKAAKHWASLIHSQLPPAQAREGTRYDGYPETRLRMERTRNTTDRSCSFFSISTHGYREQDVHHIR